MESGCHRRGHRHRQHEDVVLPKKVPVAWIYLTGWMTKDQIVQFRNDIYDQDERFWKPPRRKQRSSIAPAATH